MENYRINPRIVTCGFIVICYTYPGVVHLLYPGCPVHHSRTCNYCRTINLALFVLWIVAYPQCPVFVGKVSLFRLERLRDRRYFLAGIKRKLHIICVHFKKK
jgi:hypothetical protein